MFLCTLPLTNVSRITLLHHVILREHEFFKFSEYERSTYVYPHFFLFFPPTISNCHDFSIELERRLLPVVRAIIRRRERRPEVEKAGTCSGPVRFLILLRALASRLYRVPFPFRFRARTQNRVHARKILCRIRRSLARGHNRWRCRGVWKVYPAKELSVAAARALYSAPELPPL